MMDADPVREEYARLASIYDRRWSFYLDATIRATLARLDVHPKERVLDLGCGTGTLLRALLQIATQIAQETQIAPEITFVGCDVSAEMLAIARQKLPITVALQIGDASNLSFVADAYFDVVVSTSAFHFFRRPDLVLGEVKRILKPGGRFLMTDWCRDFWTCRVLDIFLRLTNRAHFRTYALGEYREMLQNAGLEVVQTDRYRIDWFWGMMTVVAQKL